MAMTLRGTAAEYDSCISMFTGATRAAWARTTSIPNMTSTAITQSYGTHLR